MIDSLLGVLGNVPGVSIAATKQSPVLCPVASHVNRRGLNRTLIFVLLFVELGISSIDSASLFDFSECEQILMCF